MSALRALRAAAAFAAAVALAPGLRAHELWIEPESFAPAPEAVLAVHLRVGDGPPGEPVARKDARIERFALVGPEGERAVVGRDGALPAGAVRIPAAGSYLLAYQSGSARIELESAKFEAYLREEGLERVVELRRARGQSGAPGRELYARCAKALIRAGEPPAAAGFDRALGLPLELLPIADPFALPAARAEAPAVLPVRLLHHGAPLEGALVKAFALDPPFAEPLRARTDAEGRATLSLPRNGRWLVSAVHMTEAAPGNDADWQSHWASLTLHAGSLAASPQD